MKKFLIILYFTAVIIFMFLVDFPHHVDEFIGYSAGVKFAIAGHLTPNFLLHGVINSYITELYIRLFGFPDCFKNSRNIQIIFGIIVIFLLYGTGKSAISLSGGLTASFLFISTYVIVYAFHNIFPDNPVTLFYLLAAYILLRSDQKLSLGTYTITHVFLGFMIASKPASLVFLPGFYIGLLLVEGPRFSRKKKDLVKIICCSALIIVLMVFILMPQAFIYPDTAENILTLMINFTLKGEVTDISETGYISYWHHRFANKFVGIWAQQTLPVVVISVLGSLILVISRIVRRKHLSRFEKIIVIPFWIHMLILISLLYTIRRHYIPLFPLMFLITAWFLTCILSRIKYRSVKIIFVILFVIFPGIVRIGFVMKNHTQPAPIYKMYDELRNVVQQGDTVKLWFEPNQFFLGTAYYKPYFPYTFAEGGLNHTNILYGISSEHRCIITITQEGISENTSRKKSVNVRTGKSSWIRRLFPTLVWLENLIYKEKKQLKQFVVQVN